MSELDPNQRFVEVSVRHLSRSKIVLFFVTNGFAIGYTLFIGLAMSPIALMLRLPQSPLLNRDISAQTEMPK